jgi:bifunctional polynucleotide phosphatase/kinase
VPILGMDLDWTLIKPASGNIHPVSYDDWQFLNNDLTEVCNKINNGYKFIIFTNQGSLLDNLPNRLNLEQFKARWLSIYEHLQQKYNITSVWMIASLRNDLCRKPNIGMWKYIESFMNIDKDKSIFIGDMAGREKDHTDFDIEFANNIGILFNTPELFYCNIVNV